MVSDDSPTVSVVIPAYRTAGTLHAAVNSVLSQTLQDFEIIIIEDHSQDDTLGVAQAAAASDTRIRLIALDQNRGQAHALNLGARHARGRWVATLDADDVYLPGRLDVLVRCGEAEAVDLVADNQNHVDDAAGVLVRTAFPVSDGGRIITLDDFISTNSTRSGFSFGILKPMIRREFILKHNLTYPENLKLAQDFYHLMQFFAAGGRGYLVNQPYYVWTLPFGPLSRQWTTTGLGAWRYDYTGTLAANDHFIKLMSDAGQDRLVALLHRRAQEYRTMIHYIAAQKTLAETGNLLAAGAIIAKHPATWPLLARRLVERSARSVASLRPRVFGAAS
jgi:succinoglycan biosynthesis protein ExoO